MKHDNDKTAPADGEAAARLAPRKLQKPLRADGDARADELATYSDEFAFQVR